MIVNYFVCPVELKTDMPDAKLALGMTARTPLKSATSYLQMSEHKT
jgi:hypothetical protein